MARQREFDTTEALTAAMNSFWENGYSCTSVTELLEAMKLQKGSLYRAFGSKHELFIESLKIYVNEMGKCTQELLKQYSTPYDTIEAWLKQKVKMTSEDETGKGCFLMNTLIELASEDNEVRDILIESMHNMSGLLIEIVEKGQRTGEFRNDKPADKLVGMLMMHTSGLYVVSRGKVDFLKKFDQTDLIMEILSP